MKIYKFVFFAFCIAVLHFAFFIFNLGRVYAQNLALSISPPLLEIMIRPGKSATAVFKITNDGDPVIMQAKLSELTRDGIKENPDFVPEKWLTTESSAIVFDHPFLLNSKETKQLTLKISPAADTAEADYYRVLQFTTIPNPALDTSQTSVAQNIGSPLLIVVTATGNIQKSALIKRFTIPRIMDSFDNLKMQIEVENNGKTYFRPVGKISMDGPLGHGTYDIIPQVILAGQTKTIAAEDTFESLTNNITLSMPGFFIGKYTISTDFTLDESKIRLTEKKTLYALPWKIILGIISTIFLLSWIVKRARIPNHDKSKQHE